MPSLTLINDATRFQYLIIQVVVDLPCVSSLIFSHWISFYYLYKTNEQTLPYPSDLQE